jgi:hypothetical protein
MSLLDFFIYYVPYAAFKYHNDSETPKFSGIIMLLAIAIMYVLSLYFYLATLFDWLEGIFSNDPLVNKYVIAPIISGVILLVMFIRYAANRNIYAEKFRLFDNHNIAERKKFTRLFWLFFISSFLIFVSSVTTPLWLK